MKKLDLGKWVVLIAHALPLWVLCAVLMFAGMSLNIGNIQSGLAYI